MKTRVAEKYDVVGDVHGMSRTLDVLVRKLGYARLKDKWYHPQGRRLVFVGDILDRGPDPLGCAKLVMELAENGRALLVMGNHELNALHYMHGFREKNDRTTRQFLTTLRQISEDPATWVRFEAFLRSTPTRLELDDGRLRVVHACWDDASLAELPVFLDTRHALRATARGGRWRRAADLCFKGPEAPCERFLDKDGVERTGAKVPWWEDYPKYRPIVAFGHYWFPWRRSGVPVETPRLLGPGQNAVCVDFGVGKGGELVAFRYPEGNFESVKCVDRTDFAAG